MGREWFGISSARSAQLSRSHVQTSRLSDMKPSPGRTSSGRDHNHGDEGRWRRRLSKSATDACNWAEASKPTRGMPGVKRNLAWLTARRWSKTRHSCQSASARAGAFEGRITWQIFGDSSAMSHTKSGIMIMTGKDKCGRSSTTSLFFFS